MIPIPNQRMSSQKGDHFKRKFHCPTIDFQGMFARSWSNILIFLKIDTSLNYVVYIYIYLYIYIHTGIFIQLHFISKGCPPEKERAQVMLSEKLRKYSTGRVAREGCGG